MVARTGPGLLEGGGAKPGGPHAALGVHRFLPALSPGRSVPCLSVFCLRVPQEVRDALCPGRELRRCRVAGSGRSPCPLLGLPQRMTGRWVSVVARHWPGPGGLVGGHGGEIQGSEPGAVAWAGTADWRDGEGQASVSSSTAEDDEASSVEKQLEKAGSPLPRADTRPMTAPRGVPSPHLRGGPAWDREI